METDALVAVLYTRHLHELTYYISKMVSNREEQEDVLQETFLRAMENLEKLEGLDEKQRRAWLYRVSRNIVIDRVRRARPEEELEERGYEDDALNAVAVAQLVGRLPAHERTVFILRYFEDYNATEIGELLHIPAATARTRLAQAKQKLKKWMEV